MIGGLSSLLKKIPLGGRRLDDKRPFPKAEQPSGYPAPRPTRTQERMRLVAVTRILDEADIVEAFVRHTASYAQHHIFIDNGSQDGTLEIIEKLKEEGFSISVFQNKAASFSEVAFNTILYHEAVGANDADWVIFLDADEFIDDRGTPSGLRDHLDALTDTQPDLQLLKISLTDYVATRSDDAGNPIVPLRMTKHRPTGENERIIVHFALAHLGATVDNGAHDVRVNGVPVSAVFRERRIALAHYSERCAYQYISKFIKGWAKVLAAGEPVVDRGTSWHYRAPFEIMRDRPMALLHSEHFMKYKGEGPDLVDDPIEYRGGALRYSSEVDELARAIRSTVGFVELLALQHGRLVNECPEARALVDRWNAEKVRIS